MKTYTIDKLCGSAWSEAIQEIAEVINEELGTRLFRVRNWREIENISARLGVRFNINGEIVKGV